MPRVGNQTPTYSWCSSYTRTQGRVAVELSNSYGLRPHPWQRTILDDWLALDDDGRLLNSLCLLIVSRQNGKALALDTEIPTPDGWRTMADVHVGDYVFGQDGKSSRVTLESEIFDKPMYRVSFDDGSTIHASADHIWTVQTKETKCRPSKKCHGDGWYEATTEQLSKNAIFHRNDGRIEYRYRVPMNAPVEYPAKELPIPPYALGAWLGDGTSKNATITVSEQDMEETSRLFAECGYPLTRLKHKDRAPMFRIGDRSKSRYDSGSFYARLKSLGVICNKHIPDAYMTASVKQRWDLLQGLMDTDGFCSKAGECEFAQKKRLLCEQVLELCFSLGIKARMHSKRATCNGVDAGIVYRVTFFTDASRPCFKMERKRARLKESIAYRTTYKAISNIERIPNEPSKCIAIDNESHLYLAGRTYTATHNTGACDPRETEGLVIRGERILHTAQEYQTSRVAFDRLREKFGSCKNDPNARYPELNKLVEKYTTSANQMVLDLTNGGHIEFRTRGSGGDTGRGGTFDLVVIDEAQSYTEEQDAALSPLNSAAPLGSPQTILMGTVPDPKKPYKGEVFRRLRNAAHQDPYTGLCIHEWSADEIGDVLDEERWYEYNPSLGYQLLISALRKDAKGMSADTFAQEHLGWWGAYTATANPINAKDWDECEIDPSDVPTDGDVVYAVKFSPDGASGVISACLIPHDRHRRLHVEVVSVATLNRGVSKFAEFLADVSEFAECIVIDGRSNAQTLTDGLLDRGVDEYMLVRPSANDMIAACTGFVDATRSRRLTHIVDETTDESAKGCGRRKIGTSGGYGFEDKDNASAAVVESMALAYWKALQIEREPDEDMEINL